MRHLCWSARAAIASFNPRTHTGCDTKVCNMSVGISCFNPRTHTGCDPSHVIVSIYNKKFQSTHPHGARLTLMSEHQEYLMGFNPRTHTGCDLVLILPLSLLTVSIHAPTRGATDKSSSIKRSSTSFNPRTHTGCDIVFFCQRCTNTVSIHAPTRGATYIILSCPVGHHVSIHAPTRGATSSSVKRPEIR